MDPADKAAPMGGKPAGWSRTLVNQALLAWSRSPGNFCL